MNKIPNRQAICETLMAHAKEDRHIYALCPTPEVRLL